MNLSSLYIKVYILEAANPAKRYQSSQEGLTFLEYIFVFSVCWFSESS